MLEINKIDRFAFKRAKKKEEKVSESPIQSLQRIPVGRRRRRRRLVSEVTSDKFCSFKAPIPSPYFGFDAIQFLGLNIKWSRQYRKPSGVTLDRMALIETFGIL